MALPASVMQQTGTLPGCDGCLHPQGPALGRHWQESLGGVCILGCVLWSSTQCTRPRPSNGCGQHWHGPALAPKISNMAIGGGVVVSPGFMGRWPWPGGCAVGEGSLGVLMSHGHGVGLLWESILASPEGCPCSLMDLLPCGHGAGPAGAAWPWGCTRADPAGQDSQDTLQPLLDHCMAAPCTLSLGLANAPASL